MKIIVQIIIPIIALINIYNKLYCCNSNFDFTKGIYIYVSFSMPESSLKKLLLDTAKSKFNAGLILRGLKDNNFLHTASAVYKLLLNNDNKTKQVESGFAIYPQLFEQDNITEVPTFVWHLKNKKIILKGDVSLDFFIEKAKESLILPENKFKSIIDLGVWGNLYEIKEENLIEVMKRKAKNLNFKKIINEAKENFWKYTPKFNIPEAKENKKYYIDLSFILENDIILPDGKILYHKGQIINPLDYKKLNSEILIFDYTKKEQVKFVKKYLKKHKNKNLILITSNFPDNSTLSLLNEMFKTFNKRVYLLDKFLIDKLKIKELPVLVKQRDKLIEVNVFKIKKEIKKEANYD